MRMYRAFGCRAHASFSRTDVTALLSNWRSAFQALSPNSIIASLQKIALEKDASASHESPSHDSVYWC